jgi:TolA-binding protein
VAPKAVETWSQKVAAGRFDEVIALGERRGLSRVYEQGELEELQALADAARYVRKPDVARPALLAIRKRFGTSRAAHEAAFFLGRLEEDRGAPNVALQMYDRYLSDQPSGVHASHALGRKLLIIHEQRGPEAALPIAREYLARFPEGPYAATAKKLVGAQ